LASFIQYKTDDDISWVIHQHRQLVAEYLDYHGDKEKPALAIIKSRSNNITRIFRIAYETKNYEVYEKYSSLVLFLTREVEDDEFDNQLSEEELECFVLEKQKEFKMRFELINIKTSRIAYDLNQDLVLVSIYSLKPPLRQERMILKFSKTLQEMAFGLL
jgi:hypothetical protein